MNKILIVGNGFDLNLGLKTSYTDFLTSKELKSLVDGNNHLALCLKQLQEINAEETPEPRWVDIEHELKAYSFFLKNFEYLYRQIPNDVSLVQTMMEGINVPKGYKKTIKTFLCLVVYNFHTNGASLNDVACLLRHGVEHGQRFQGMLNYVETYEKGKITQYADYLSAFKSEYVALKNALTSYLVRIETESDSKARGETDAFKLLNYGRLFDEDKKYLDLNWVKKEEVCSFKQIYTLNFTNALGLIEFTPNDVSNNTDLFYMHGSCEQGNIVFGVEDKVVDDDFLFLTKSSHAAFGSAPDLSKAMTAAKEIHIFGCSLGDTDNAHFQHPFSALSQRRHTENQPNNEQKTKIIFYVWGAEGYQNILRRILFLTDGRMAEFKLVNEVVFFDLESHKVIDQAWINNH